MKERKWLLCLKAIARVLPYLDSEKGWGEDPYEVIVVDSSRCPSSGITLLWRYIYVSWLDITDTDIVVTE